MAGVSGLLILVSIASWYHVRTKNLIFASFALSALFIKALLLALEIISQDEKGIIIDFAVVIFLYLSVIGK